MQRLHVGLHQQHGARLPRVLLYGARARGTARPDPDYDVAIFLEGPTDRWAEMQRLGDIGTEILNDTGMFVHATPFAEADLLAGTMLMHEIRRDGRDIL